MLHSVKGLEKIDEHIAVIEAKLKDPPDDVNIENATWVLERYKKDRKHLMEKRDT